jgi:hypothetical protein
MTPKQEHSLLYVVLILIALGLSILLAGRAHCTVAHPSNASCSFLWAATAINGRLSTWQR